LICVDLFLMFKFWGEETFTNRIILKICNLKIPVQYYFIRPLKNKN
jgi:hypothetical protein